MAIDFGNIPVNSPPTEAQIERIGNVLNIITSNTTVANGGKRIKNMVAITPSEYSNLLFSNELDFDTVYLVIATDGNIVYSRGMYVDGELLTFNGNELVFS